MADLKVSDIRPEFGSEISGLVPRVPLDAETCAQLRTLFDERSLLVFRDLDADVKFQTYLSNMLIGNDASVPDDLPIMNDFYVSNERPKSAAPVGRLMYHSDSQWAMDWCFALSLYGEKVEQPAVPTMFVSSVVGWDTLPQDLRARVEGHRVIHQHDPATYQKRAAGDPDVLVNDLKASEDSPPHPIVIAHPRTGRKVLYVSQQMTRNVEGMSEQESDELLGALFDNLYAPGKELAHHWRQGDLVVWDNIALQHARPNVDSQGPARTLRKAIAPPPKLDAVASLTYSKAGAA
jgi:alpha-ketoglutarate-dependent taurine dioxygenase